MAAFYDNGHAGTWAEALTFSPFLLVKPHEPTERVFNAFKGGTDPDARAHTPAVSLPFHGEPIATPAQDNPHA